jgi:ferredoxin-NADP reductase
MATHVTQLVERELVAEGTMRFSFAKPETFRFVPGQFIELHLQNPPYTDAEGNTRAFSLVSAPHEAALSVATRMRDTAFKNSLKEMPIGADVAVEGPFGSFTLHKNAAKPAVILTGGIGITPFRSMVLHAARAKLPHEVYLFYSNRRPEGAPFLAELTRLTQENPRYRFIPTMTDMERSHGGWAGERGYINEAMLKKYVDKPADAIYYIAGPQAMVQAMWQMLVGAGIDEDSIRTEEFPGY